MQHRSLALLLVCAIALFALACGGGKKSANSSDVSGDTSGYDAGDDGDDAT